MKGIIQALAVAVAVCFCICAKTARAQYFPVSSARCLNPNQRPGTCVSIYDCQTVWSVLQRQPLQPYDVQFVRESECNDGRNYPGQRPMVCCSSDTGFSRPVPSAARPEDYFWGSAPDGDGPPPGWLFSTEEANPTPPPAPPKKKGGSSNRRPKPSSTAAPPNGAISERSKLLPQPPMCGGVSVTNRIYGGENAELFEFPWMVMFEYRRFTGDISINCAGALISDRYVLTAAHCVTGSIEKRIGPLVAIRLGEHDTSTVVDCNKFTCSPDVYRVGIEEVLPHPGYVDASPNKENDIALVRLERNIHFSNAVRPICLPSSVTGKLSAAISGSLTVAGWGRTLNASSSAIKQKLQVSLYDQKKCKRKFREIKVNIVDTQVCAGGNFAEDSCEGDSGGPLMRLDNAWMLEGIVSFGRRCGLSNWPAVHTRVSSYEDWINKNVRR